MRFATISNQYSLDLDNYKFIRLTTFRQNGQAVSTPVTFALYNGRLVVVTGARSGKVKRLRHTPRVELAPCDSRGTVLGSAVRGQARILSSDEAASRRPYLRFRAGKLLMFFFNRLRALRQGGTIYLEITMEADNAYREHQ